MTDKTTNLENGPWKTAKDDKRRRFAKFGKGWDDFMRGREANPPASWDEEERGLYHNGHAAAALAAERFRTGNAPVL